MITSSTGRRIPVTESCAKAAQIRIHERHGIGRPQDRDALAVAVLQVHQFALLHVGTTDDQADALWIELTEVDDAPEGDTLVPPFDPAMWRETAREDHRGEDGRPGFSFVTLRRR